MRIKVVLVYKLKKIYLDGCMICMCHLFTPFLRKFSIMQILLNNLAGKGYSGFEKCILGILGNYFIY